MHLKSFLLLHVALLPLCIVASTPPVAVHPAKQLGQVQQLKRYLQAETDIPKVKPLPQGQPVHPPQHNVIQPLPLPQVRALPTLSQAQEAQAVHQREPPKLDVRTANRCEEPTLPSGQFHVLVLAHEPKTCFTQWLWELGVSNAHVFIYRRAEPATPLRKWRGPCGMIVQERLLLPNEGREAAIYLDYVLEHYKNPPAATAVVHWHGPQSWHNDCASMLGRVRYAYRGLASPQKFPDAAEYASHMTTLTRAEHDGDLGLWMNVSLRFMRHPDETRVPSYVNRPDGNLHLHQSCVDLFTRYGIDLSARTFYSCCATFVIPWDRILSLPMAFYKEFLEVAFSDAERNDPEFGYGCWEFGLWQWYKEPPLTPRMEELYMQAQNVSLDLDLTKCLTPALHC